LVAVVSRKRVTLQLDMTDVKIKTLLISDSSFKVATFLYHFVTYNVNAIIPWRVVFAARLTDGIGVPEDCPVFG
jgi:hypothetical protein